LSRGTSQIVGSILATLRGSVHGAEGYLFIKENYTDVQVPQVAPGNYRCNFNAPAKGIYVGRINAEKNKLVENVAFIVSLDSEDTSLTTNDAIGKTWAETGQGLFNAKHASIMDFGNKKRDKFTDISHLLLIFAALVFIMDVVVRRWPAFIQSLTGKRSGGPK